MNLERAIHAAGVALGASVLLAGVVLLFLPDVTEGLPVTMLAANLAALLGFILAVWVARTRYRTEPNETLVPDIEFTLSTPTPGDEIDDIIYRMTVLDEGVIEYREQIQERVAEVAISIITDRLQCSREEAIEKIRQGSWTDDETAANYFMSGGASGSPSLFEQILGKYTSRESPFETQLRATITAIEELGEFEFEQRPEGAEDETPIDGMDSAGVLDADRGQQVTETVRYLPRFRTYHWSGITAFALLALAAGVITNQESLIVASALGVGLAGYARTSMDPQLTDLDVTRTVSDEDPEPGDEIDVTVTVENTGGTLLSDLKLIDRVPPMWEVVDGSARRGTVLRPDQSVTLSYTAVVDRGTHKWPLQAIGRDMSGEFEREALIETDTQVDCVPRLKTATEMPVRMQTSVFSGEVETTRGGEGLEFFSIRDYQSGDPKRRINWKQYAKTGELSTVDFREEHAARAVLLFDGRESSYVAPAPGKKHAVNMSVDAAYDVFASLYDQGNLVGIAAYNGIPCWLGPNTGTLHLQRTRQVFVDHPAISPLPPDLSEEEAGRYVDPMVHIRRQLPKNTQIFLFSPLTDTYTYEVARQFDGSGHLVTVLSPNPTAGRTIGQRLARLERRMIIKRLRDHGIRVVDFGENRRFHVELEHAQRRWGA